VGSPADIIMILQDIFTYTSSETGPIWIKLSRYNYGKSIISDPVEL